MSSAQPNFRSGRHQCPNQLPLAASHLIPTGNDASRELSGQPWQSASVFATTDVSSRIHIPPDFSWFPVAHGGFCWLYRAKLETELSGLQQSTSEVVVKIYASEPEDGTSRELACTRLAREAVVLRAAQHPQVVEFYGTAVIHGRPALVLRWYGNGDAKRALKSKTTGQKVQVIKDIAVAMEYLHSKNIIHGDLKGNNVLISDNGRGILTDFGLSHFTDGHTGYTTSSSSATIPWLSPELASLFLPSKDRNVSPPTIRTRTMASDVWAFGSTAFELLSGKVPYKGLQDFLILQAISEGVSPLMNSPSTVFNPPEIIGVLAQCWQFEPRLRLKMADVVEMLSML